MWTSGLLLSFVRRKSDTCMQTFIHLKSCFCVSFLTSGVDVKNVFHFSWLYNPVLFLKKKKKAWIFTQNSLKMQQNMLQTNKNLLVSCLLVRSIRSSVSEMYFTLLFPSKNWTLLALNDFFSECRERKSFSL